ncbi:hypothetical protein ACFSKW_34980 [Nonomuraea mangrovi]|uniref:Uncharacterized protein n=1 Tax=Nonomuraea mangrovi TaxID=2316207 RepID=A0ABW4T5I1_9ACTN
MHRSLLPALLGLALGALALGPALGWGFVLVQDMVFVPDPVFSTFTFGLSGGAPRVVPSDAVVTALAQVLPAELVQKAILLGIFVLGCSGAARLVPSESVVPRLVAGACYAWNPYVAERLLMGQWALLLGYAGLPWVVRAACGRRLALALVPAAVGGFAAMSISALTVLPVAAQCRRWVRVGALVLLFSLPWLMLAVVRPRVLAGDPVGVDAFAARADGPFGAVGSLLSLGGVWNANAVPAGYDTWLGAVARLSLALAGIAGFCLATPPSGAAREGVALRRGLGVAAVAGFVIACLGVFQPGRDLLRWLVGVWGGFAVLRDAQQFVAPLALLVAIGLGQLTARVTARWAALMVVAPLAALPTLTWGALDAVPYPRAWMEARAIIQQDREPGDVLVLPFESYRRFSWNGGRAVLDPAQRFFAAPGREVVADDSVRVGSMVVAAEDPRAEQVERVLKRPSESLATAGFRYVVVDAGTPEEWAGFAARLGAASLLLDRRELRLYRFEGPVAPVASH